MKRLWMIIITACLLAACAPAQTATPSSPPKLYEAIGATFAAATAAPAATMAPAPTAVSSGYPPPAPGSPAQLAFAPAESGMVVKDAQVDLLVEDTDRVIDQVTQMLSTEGGYLISSQTWLSEGYKYATLELGIPSGRFEVVLTRVRNLAVQVVREHATGQDVTATYVDLQSRLTNLEATAARVRDFLKDAQTTEDSLRINQQLSELEAQIEQVKGQMHYYEGRSAFSTLTLNLTPQHPTPTPTATPTPVPAVVWNPGKTLDRASNTLVLSLQTLVDGLIWLVVGLGPFLVALALIILVLRRLFWRPAGK